MQNHQPRRAAGLRPDRHYAARLFSYSFAIPFVASCQHGVAPLWSQAKPETVIEVDPVARRVYVHSSDGRGVTAHKLGFKHNGTEFTVEDLTITERSVENRAANAQQLEAAARVTAEAMRPLDHFLATLAARVPGAIPPSTQPSGP